MLAKQFVADGHKVYVATLMPSLYEGIEELIPQGVSVIQLKQPTWNPKNIKILRSIVKENDIDVILNQWALHCELSFICNRARKGTKCKLISELHGAPDTTKMIIELNDRLKQSGNPLSFTFGRLYRNIDFIRKIKENGQYMRNRECHWYFR